MSCTGTRPNHYLLGSTLLRARSFTTRAAAVSECMGASTAVSNAGSWSCVVGRQCATGAQNIITNAVRRRVAGALAGFIAGRERRGSCYGRRTYYRVDCSFFAPANSHRLFITRGTVHGGSRGVYCMAMQQSSHHVSCLLRNALSMLRETRKSYDDIVSQTKHLMHFSDMNNT